MLLYFTVETVDTVTDKTWEDDLMKGPNGEVVMGEVMKNQETTSSDMPVSQILWVSVLIPPFVFRFTVSMTK